MYSVISEIGSIDKLCMTEQSSTKSNQSKKSTKTQRLSHTFENVKSTTSVWTLKVSIYFKHAALRAVGLTSNVKFLAGGTWGDSIDSLDGDVFWSWSWLLSDFFRCWTFSKDFLDFFRIICV